MSMDLGKVSAGLTQFWTDYGALVILGTGVLALGLVVWGLWRFNKTGNKSKVVSTFAAVVVMLWTSEGLLQAALGTFRIPWQFAVVAFFVFEAMMLAAALKAEENRKARGLPGAAGQYVFVIAVASGVITAFGADAAGLIALRVILPPLAVGLWWILLVSDRDDDSPEIQAKREQAHADREATWAITPQTVLVRLGIKRPGKTTTTEAQREYLRDRMVALADTAEALPTSSRRRRRLVRKLRVLTRAADEALVDEVAERVDRARRAEELMIPRQGQPSAKGSEPARVAARETVPQPRGQVEAGKSIERAHLPTLPTGQVNGHTLTTLLTPAQADPAQDDQLPTLNLPTPAGNSGQPANGYRAAGTLPEDRAAAVPVRADPGLSGKDMSDEEVMAVYGPDLIAEARRRPAGQIGRSIVQTRCGIGSTRAERIMARVNEAAASLPDGDQGVTPLG